MSDALRLVVFDVDGTLVDSQREIIAAMESAFAAIGLPAPEPQQTLSIVGLSLPVAIARLLPVPEPVLVARLADAYRASFMQQRKASRVPPPLYPGALSVLEQLAAEPELLMGVATGKSRRGLDHMLSAHDLGRFFVTTQVADDHPSKPNPAMLAAALRDTGADAARSVMVGDTSYDIEMGRAAGFRTIAVAWGYHDKAVLKDAGADLVIADFHELVPALDAMWSMTA